MASCSTPTDRAIPPGARQDQHHRAPTSAGRSAPPDAARAPRPNYWPRSAELSAPPTPKRRHDQGSRREQHRRDPHPWVAQLHGRSPGSLHIRRDRTARRDQTGLSATEQRHHQRARQEQHHRDRAACLGQAGHSRSHRHPSSAPTRDHGRSSTAATPTRESLSSAGRSPGPRHIATAEGIAATKQNPSAATASRAEPPSKVTAGTAPPQSPPPRSAPRAATPRDPGGPGCSVPSGAAAGRATSP